MQLEPNMYSFIPKTQQRIMSKQKVFLVFFGLILVVLQAVKADSFLSKCDGESANLKCSGGKVISIYRADYGRWHKHECQKNSAIHCRPTSILMTAKQLCNNQPSCTLEASPRYFADDCPGVPKYLEIGYECV